MEKEISLYSSGGKKGFKRWFRTGAEATIRGRMRKASEHILMLPEEPERDPYSIARPAVCTRENSGQGSGYEKKGWLACVFLERAGSQVSKKGRDALTNAPEGAGRDLLPIPSPVQPYANAKTRVRGVGIRRECG